MRNQHIEALIDAAGSKEFLAAREALNSDEDGTELDEVA